MTSTRLNTDWMLRDEYKPWLEPVLSDNTKSKIQILYENIFTSNMGHIGMKSHANGKRQIVSGKFYPTGSFTQFFQAKSDKNAEKSQTRNLVQVEILELITYSATGTGMLVKRALTSNENKVSSSGFIERCLIFLMKSVLSFTKDEVLPQ